MTSEETGSVVEVHREDHAQTRVVDGPGHDIGEGEALLRVDTFALTANNVTYAVLGDFLQYWKFFPGSEEGWGRVPVWGFADVVASRAEGVEEGARLWGYLPMATDFVVQPERVGGGSFMDGALHRAELHAVYNRYQQTDADPGYDPAHEPLQMLLRPLFATSF